MVTYVKRHRGSGYEEHWVLIRSTQGVPPDVCGYIYGEVLCQDERSSVFTWLHRDKRQVTLRGPWERHELQEL